MMRNFKVIEKCPNMNFIKKKINNFTSYFFYQIKAILNYKSYKFEF